MSVRVAGADDVSALFDVRTSVRENHMSLEELEAVGVTPESVAEMLETNSRAWVAEEDGRVVAFSMADAGKATVFAVFVRPGNEGRGHGRALTRAAERWLFSRGYDEIWLLTGGDPSLRAHGFYRRLGWTAAGVEDDGQVRYVLRREDAPT